MSQQASKPKQPFEFCLPISQRSRATVLDGNLDAIRQPARNLAYPISIQTGSEWTKIQVRVKQEIPSSSPPPSKSPSSYPRRSPTKDVSESGFPSQASHAAPSLSDSPTTLVGDADSQNSILAVLSARGIGHLAEMLRKDGFVSIEDLSHLQQLPDLTKDLVLREWKDSRKMALKDWAKLHALIYSGSL